MKLFTNQTTTKDDATGQVKTTCSICQCSIELGLTAIYDRFQADTGAYVCLDHLSEERRIEAKAIADNPANNAVYIRGFLFPKGSAFLADFQSKLQAAGIKA
jgi:hypothetical protein